jgi:protein-S-isoprenylcysteine O-methyltransferase Ste14
MTRQVLIALWGVFYAYWLLRAVGTSPTAQAARPLLDRLHLLFVVAGLTLILSPLGDVLGAAPRRFAAVREIVGIGLTVAGLGFAVWARVWLGRYWSSAIVLKQDHALVTGGPYRLVRHPIYSGVSLAAVGSLIAMATPAAVCGFAVFAATYFAKIRREERWLRRFFGAEYDAYAARVAAIVPGIL